MLLVFAATAAAGELLVVASQRFHADLAPFVAAKRIKTSLVAFDGDDPEQLKRRLYEGCKKGARYVLLVGDGETDHWHGCLSLATLKRLPHGKRRPVVFSVGCSTAAFAPLPPYDGTNHGQVFTSPRPLRTRCR